MSDLSKLTEELMHDPEFKREYEAIQSEKSGMYPEHRFVMSNLEKILDRFAAGLKCVILREAKYQWKDADDKKYEPDISILCGLRHRKRLCYTDVPRFVAEVLSDSTEETDRGEKMEVYAKVGIQEYWLIDWRIPGGKVERYMLNDEGDRYLLHDTVTGSGREKINIISFPHWEFSMEELMGSYRRRRDYRIGIRN